jgi:hypothetical protein
LSAAASAKVRPVIGRSLRVVHSVPQPRDKPTPRPQPSLRQGLGPAQSRFRLLEPLNYDPAIHKSASSNSRRSPPRSLGFCSPRWLSGKGIRRPWRPGAFRRSPWLLAAARVAEHPFQAVAVAIWWLWSFRRLCVAAISRHSDRTADRPRRWNRSIFRLNFTCANTGSIIPWGLR